MFKSREFTFFTDHKHLTHDLFRVSPPWSARQQLHLSYLAEFTSTLVNLPGPESIVAVVYTFTLQYQPFLTLWGGFLTYTSTSWALYPPVKDFLIFWQWSTGQLVCQRWLCWLPSQLNPVFKLFSQFGFRGLVSRSPHLRQRMAQFTSSIWSGVCSSIGLV